MSLVDKLLQLDAGKLAEKPTREVELERLSALLGVPAVFKCQALDGETYTNIQRKAVRLSKRGGIQDIDVFEMQLMTCVEGIVEPDVKDKRLLEHFNAPTPKELLKKMLLPGEIAELHNVVNELGGYDREGNEDEIKN